MEYSARLTVFHLLAFSHKADTSHAHNNTNRTDVALRLHVRIKGLGFIVPHILIVILMYILYFKCKLQSPVEKYFYLHYSIRYVYSCRTYAYYDDYNSYFSKMMA